MNLISAFSKDIWNNKDIYATYKFRETFQRSIVLRVKLVSSKARPNEMWSKKFEEVRSGNQGRPWSGARVDAWRNAAYDVTGVARSEAEAAWARAPAATPPVLPLFHATRVFLDSVT